MEEEQPKKVQRTESLERVPIKKIEKQNSLKLDLKRVNETAEKNTM